jgi:hypothetical protein
MDNVPTQTAGTSAILASDWNVYVRDNFDSIKFGHLVVADNAARPTGVAEGTMVYTLDSKKVWVYDGSGWVEVNDLDNAGGLSDAASVLAPSAIVSSLPGSPVDGQIINYQDATMASSGVVWRLRYRSGATGSYKWEFVGGAPLSIQNDNLWTVNSTTAYGGPANNETLAIPLSGDYEVTIRHRCWGSVVINQITLFLVNVTGTSNLSSNVVISTIHHAVDEYHSPSATGIISNFTAQTVRWAMITTNTQGRSETRYMGFRPVRVG